jgi:hypothetical protein
MSSLRRNALRKEHKIRTFEITVLRKIIGSKKWELKIEERKLYNEDLHGFCSSPDIINAMKHKSVRWESYEGRMGWIRNEYTILVGKSEGEETNWENWA